MKRDIKRNRNGEETVRVNNWGNKEFLALLRSFSEIPPHLYVSAEGDQLPKVECVLIDSVAGREGHVAFKECYCNENVEKPRVILQKSKLMKEGRVIGDIPTIVHDLVHRFIDQSLDEYTHDLLEILHVTPEEGIREFLSTASEYYIQGKKVFSETYRNVLSDKEQEALYEFLKDKIFKGREYPSIV